MSPWAALLRQPVLVVLFAAALGVFGLAAVATLPIRASPIIPTRLVDIQTGFPGADAQTMDKFVTLVLESSITSLSGVKYVTGTSHSGSSDIQAFLDDDADPNTVFAEVLAAVNAERQNLPPEIEAPNVSLIGDDNANQELNAVVLFPPTASVAAVTEYVQTNIVPRLETIPGIGPVNLESDTPSLRVEMNPLRMQALGITPAEVAAQLSSATAVNSGGVLRNAAEAMQVDIRSGLETPAAFDALPVPVHGGGTVPLRSFASAQIGFSAGSGISWWDRRECVYLAAGIAPTGNIITVASAFSKMLKSMQPTVPPGLQLLDIYDTAVSVRQSLTDLAYTLVITILLVGFIVRLSLGTMRAAAAPFLAILLSLLGAAIVMQVTAQTLNLFTIIALVLAVGLVVDDAIVVVEDIFRRVQEGEAPLNAASASATRLAPVLAAISSTLVVAFLPLGFLSGLTSALFRPFALVLISAFLLSLLIAVTIVPSMAMWASKTYEHRETLSFIDRLRDGYARALAPALRFSPLIAGVVLAVAVGCVALLQVVPKNLVPAADAQGAAELSGLDVCDGARARDPGRLWVRHAGAGQGRRRESLGRAAETQRRGGVCEPGKRYAGKRGSAGFGDYFRADGCGAAVESGDADSGRGAGEREVQLHQHQPRAAAVSIYAADRSAVGGAAWHYRYRDRRCGSGVVVRRAARPGERARRHHGYRRGAAVDRRGADAEGYPDPDRQRGASAAGDGGDSGDAGIAGCAGIVAGAAECDDYRAADAGRFIERGAGRIAERIPQAEHARSDIRV
jgi:hypothetical protein